jgi:pimeloyl-ACP methyl ester carboxylesterase
MPDQAIEDITIHYEVCGQGPPLLLLHGFTATGSQWTPFLPQLEGEYRVIVPDLPGHGRSTIPCAGFSCRKTAEYLYGLLDAIAVSDFHALGFSAGGATLLHMATQQPDRIKKLVLWSAGAFLPTRGRQICAGIDPDVFDADEPGLKEHVGGVDQVKWILRQFRDFKDSYDDVNFTPPRLSMIKAATLIIHGDRDDFYPVSMPCSLYEAIPKAYLWIFPNTNHLFPDDTTAEIIRRCRAFFAGNWD